MRSGLCAGFAILLALPAAADMPKVAPEGPVWKTAPGFAFPGADKPKKLRRALSGIACPGASNGSRLCIAVFDEGGEARYVMIDGARMVPQPEPIALLPGNRELDAEGAAVDGRFVYVTGSHSRKREPCLANADSRHVYRLVLQPDGRVQQSPPPVDDQGRLWAVMSADPVLSPFVDKCLGKDGHGINIEGLAARGGQLYFGFREPARDRTAHILRVSADALFDGGDLAPALFTLNAGKSSGIRDLLTVPGGMLVLIGPDDDSKQGVSWWIGFWDANDASRVITLQKPVALKLPKVSGGGCQKEIKPEAMTLLADDAATRRILILSDGMCDGGPLAFRIPK